MKATHYVLSGALPSQYCEHVIQRAENYPIQPATIGFENGFHEDKQIRRSVIKWLQPDGADSDIAAKMMKFVKQANRSTFGFDIDTLYDLQFTEYHAADDGCYNWHQDTWFENPDPTDRKISVVIQLSNPNDYEGGQFEFFGSIDLFDTFLPQGSVLIFPSFMPHRVTPVTKGIRRSLVSWVEGPKWR
jgi:PKHD-type hydroxylase